MKRPVFGRILLFLLAMVMLAVLVVLPGMAIVWSYSFSHSGTASVSHPHQVDIESLGRILPCLFSLLLAIGWLTRDFLGEQIRFDGDWRSKCENPIPEEVAAVLDIRQRHRKQLVWVAKIAMAAGFIGIITIYFSTK